MEYSTLYFVIVFNEADCSTKNYILLLLLLKKMKKEDIVLVVVFYMIMPVSHHYRGESWVIFMNFYSPICLLLCIRSHTVRLCAKTREIFFFI